MELRLHEESALEVDVGILNEEEALELAERYVRYFSVEFPGPQRRHAYVVRAKSYIGLFPLASGRVVQVLPKVPCQALWSMLAYAYDLRSLHWGSGEVLCETVEDLCDALVGQLVRRINDRCRRGLYWDYRQREAVGSKLRGRILGHDSRMDWYLRYRFDEGGVDNRENQILLRALYAIRCMPLRKAVRREVERAYRPLRSQVSLVEVQAFDYRQLHYHRLNADYCLLHSLCRFFLENLAPGKGEGTQPALPYALQMSSLFEECVAEWIDTTLGEQYVIKKQWQLELEGNSRLSFRLDLALLNRENGIPLAVVDTKYKIDVDPASEDLQQIVAYAVRLGVDTAILVYPIKAIKPLVLRIGDVRVHTIGLDLGEADWAIAGRFLNDILIDILSHSDNYVNKIENTIESEFSS